MNSQGAVVGTEVLAYAHMVADMKKPSIANIRTLLQIDRFAARGKQMFRTAVAQSIRHRTKTRYGGFRQTTCKSIIYYQPKCSHILYILNRLQRYIKKSVCANIKEWY